MRHFEWNAAIRPYLADNPANNFSGSDVGRMILAPMHHGNSRLSAHEAVNNLFSNGGNARQPQSLVDDRRNDRYGLSSADQRIAKPVAVHFHKVGAIYNNCTGGSMLNVLSGPY